MKRISVFLAAMIILSCNNESTTANDSKDTTRPADTTTTRSEAPCTGPEPDYTKWRVNYTTAQAMLRAAKSCNDFKIENGNWAIQKQIDAAFSTDSFDRGWFMAKHLASNREYATLRCIDPASPRAQVKDHCTQLYLVWKKTVGTTTVARTSSETNYFDIITICPPPPGETCDSFRKYLDSLKKNNPQLKQ